MDTFFVVGNLVRVLVIWSLAFIVYALIRSIFAAFFLEIAKLNYYMPCNYDPNKFIRHIDVHGDEITVIDQFDRQEVVKSSAIDQVFQYPTSYNIQYEKSIRALLFFRKAPCLFPDKVVFLKHEPQNIHGLSFVDLCQTITNERYSVNDVTSFKTLFGFLVYGLLDGYEIQIHSNCILVVFDGMYLFCVQVDDCCQYLGTIHVAWSYPIVLKVDQSFFRMVISTEIYVGMVYKKIVNIKPQNFWFDERLQSEELNKIFGSLIFTSCVDQLPETETDYLNKCISQSQKVKEYRKTSSDEIYDL